MSNVSGQLLIPWKKIACLILIPPGENVTQQALARGIFARGLEFMGAAS